LYFIRPEEISSNKENQNEWSKDKSEEYFLKALQVKESSLGPSHPDVARILTRLGSLYIERVQMNIAEKHLVRAYEIRKQKLGSFHSRTGQTLKHMMTLYEAQENVPKAIEAGLEAKTIYEKLGGTSNMTAVAIICLRLSELYMQTKEGEKRSKACKCLDRALEIRLPMLGPDHPDVLEIKRAIETLSRPPPPPLPKKKLVQPTTTVEQKRTAVADLVIDKSRSALLEDIRKFGQKAQAKKPLEKKPTMKFKQRKNYFDSADWWKQNYTYAKT